MSSDGDVEFLSFRPAAIPILNAVAITAEDSGLYLATFPAALDDPASGENVVVTYQFSPPDPSGEFYGDNFDFTFNISVPEGSIPFECKFVKFVSGQNRAGVRCLESAFFSLSKAKVASGDGRKDVYRVEVSDSALANMVESGSPFEIILSGNDGDSIDEIAPDARRSFLIPNKMVVAALFHALPYAFEDRYANLPNRKNSAPPGVEAISKGIASQGGEKIADSPASNREAGSGGMGSNKEAESDTGAMLLGFAAIALMIYGAWKLLSYLFF